MPRGSAYLPSSACADSSRLRGAHWHRLRARTLRFAWYVRVRVRQQYNPAALVRLLYVVWLILDVWHPVAGRYYGLRNRLPFFFCTPAGRKDEAGDLPALSRRSAGRTSCYCVQRQRR